MLSYLVPPGGVNITATPSDIKAHSWREQGNVIQGSGSLEEAPSNVSYLERRSYLKDSDGRAQSVYESGKKRSEIAAQMQAKTALNQTVTSITDSVRKVVGPRLAAVFDPFARTVAKGTVGEIIDGSSDGGKSLPSENAQTTTATSSKDSSTSESSKNGEAPSDIPTDASQTGAGQAASAASKAPPPAPSHPFFALEVQHFSSATDAYSMMRDLHDQGYDATYIVREYQNGQQTFHVRVGDFKTYTDATNARSLLKQPARVVIVDPQEQRVTH
jgi:cell division septation protein DedD